VLGLRVRDFVCEFGNLISFQHLFQSFRQQYVEVPAYMALVAVIVKNMQMS